MDIPDWQIEGTMEHAQYEALKKSLEQSRYRVAIAAAHLRIGRSTVYRLMRRYGIDVPDKLEDFPSAPSMAPSARTPQNGQRRSGQEKVADVVFDGTNYLLMKR